MRYTISARLSILVLALTALVGPASPAPGPNSRPSRAEETSFHLNHKGYVTNWLVAGPECAPNEASQMSGLRSQNPSLQPSKLIELNAPGPFGKPWSYLSTGDDSFVRFPDDASKASLRQVYLAVDLQANRDLEINAFFRTGCAANIWLNGKSLGSSDSGSSKQRLLLHRGRNQLVALLYNSGPGSQLAFGLQVPNQTKNLCVLLPGPHEITADFVAAENWLRAVRMGDRDCLVCNGPPPFPAQTLMDKETIEWPQSQTKCALPVNDDAPRDETHKREQALNRAAIECRKRLILIVETRVRDQFLSRGIEYPPDNPLILPARNPSLDAHRQHHLTKMLKQRPYTLTGLFDTYFVEGIIRRMRDEPPVYDKARLEAGLRRVDQRIDCADFDLAFALRFYRLGAGTEEDRARIRQSALKFRYGRNEPGNDAMVFHGENHPLLFNGDQLIAGNLWPDDVFANSGMTGKEHAALGRRLCLEWLGKIEAEGYEEFLSTTYAPITTGALMNLVDFSGDADISRRAASQVDKIYRMMSEHSFDGVMLGPQGRTSRRMLYPQVLTTQALMSYATPKAAEAFDPWVIFAASSPTYHLPLGLDKLMNSSVRKQYREAGFLISLNKTPDYMLSSIEIPAKGSSSKIAPGAHGYQQHIWDAVLARDCQVFTTHPGSNIDRGDGTPGFWTGNATFPRQTQNGSTLMQIFSIPDDHPIQFTHAYWPSKAFDAQRIRGNWAYGRKQKGYVALWCSTKPSLHSDVLIDSELRAWGNKMAWVCICSGESESGDFNTFIRSCESLRPKFDPKTLTLRLRGQRPFKWGETSGDVAPTGNLP